VYCIISRDVDKPISKDLNKEKTFQCSHSYQVTCNNKNWWPNLSFKHTDELYQTQEKERCLHIWHTFSYLFKH